MTIIGDVCRPIEKAWDTNKIFSPKSHGYYPTFITVYDDIHTLPHFYAYYVIYDKNKEVKYFLCANGLKNSMKVLSKHEVLEQLKIYKQIFIVYSCVDIIKNYYTPV